MGVNPNCGEIEGFLMTYRKAVEFSERSNMLKP